MLALPNPLAGKPFLVREIVFSSRDGTRTVLPLGDGRTRKSVEWDESKHPRADDGRFGSGGGGEREDEAVEIDGASDARKEGEPSSIKGKWTPEAVQPATVAGVEAIIDQWEPFDYYGLRDHHDGDLGEAEVDEGGHLGNSYVWDDGEKTDEELDGTSTVAFDPSEPGSIEKALDLLKGYHTGGTWIVVGSYNSAGPGQDRGERLLRKPQAIGTLMKPPLVQ